MNTTTPTAFLYRVHHIACDEINTTPTEYKTAKMTYTEAEAKVKEMRERQPGIKVWIEAAK